MFDLLRHIGLTIPPGFETFYQWYIATSIALAVAAANR